VDEASHQCVVLDVITKNTRHLVVRSPPFLQLTFIFAVGSDVALVLVSVGSEGGRMLRCDKTSTKYLPTSEPLSRVASVTHAGCRAVREPCTPV
jgi:hypothetical protein